MAKKVMGTDGKYYKVKKPFYKRVWFWIVVVILVAGIGGVLGGGDVNKNGGTKVEADGTTSESQKDSVESSSSVEEISFYSVGDTVKVGDAEYTLTGVELTDERNQFDETNPAEVVKISYTVKNNSDSDLPVGADVDVYGSDDKKAESYPNENTMGSVAPGKQMDCVQHFGINGTGEIEIHFAPLISFEDAAIYKATI
ncbi:DUF4352 domain-containing protein [Enterococcus sp. DIV0876]|uniref:DUF4352 domain-containing protein n=1 Tax=Enterococcus sp. DIV0876 TaxID=2774633 RepID=UPI003D301350